MPVEDQCFNPCAVSGFGLASENWTFNLDGQVVPSSGSLQKLKFQSSIFVKRFGIEFATKLSISRLIEYRLPACHDSISLACIRSIDKLELRDFRDHPLPPSAEEHEFNAGGVEQSRQAHHGRKSGLSLLVLD